MNTAHAALDLFAKLYEHDDMWGMHYGLLNEHGEWCAVLVVGDTDNPCTRFADYTEPQDDPVKAVVLAMKEQIVHLSHIIRKTDDDEQRSNCQELRRAVRDTLSTVKLPTAP